MFLGVYEAKCVDFVAQLRRALFVDLRRLRPILRRRVAGDPTGFTILFLHPHTRSLVFRTSCFWAKSIWLYKEERGCEAPSGEVLNVGAALKVIRRTRPVGNAQRDSDNLTMRRAWIP